LTHRAEHWLSGKTTTQSGDEKRPVDLAARGQAELGSRGFVNRGRKTLRFHFFEPRFWRSMILLPNRRSPRGRDHAIFSVCDHGHEIFFELVEEFPSIERLKQLEQIDVAIDRTIKRLRQLKTMKQTFRQLEPKVISTSKNKNSA
jgi:hypothetical protein